ELAWFEGRPLFGKRVLVTRPRHQAGAPARRLEELGAQVLLLPAVEVRDPADWGPVDRALAELASFQWLVFTSANGVEYFLRRPRPRTAARRTVGRRRGGAGGGLLPGGRRGAGSHAGAAARGPDRLRHRHQLQYCLLAGA